ncbi:MAG: hypothetical protein DMG75_03525 [Acidobacteria bacterium]|nr:MAG: hypothetical protein DMG75_03525 [Acidobacteriota bacterium]
MQVLGVSGVADGADHVARGDVFSAAGWRVAPNNIEGVKRLTPFNRTKLRSATISDVRGAGHPARRLN